MKIKEWFVKCNKLAYKRYFLEFKRKTLLALWVQ